MTEDQLYQKFIKEGYRSDIAKKLSRRVVVLEEEEEPDEEEEEPDKEEEEPDEEDDKHL